MFGIRFVKAQPTVHLMHFKSGKIARQGVGQSFLYYAPTSTVVAIPVASADHPFMLTLVTADFQTVTVQGQVTYRVADPERLAKLMDFSVKSSGAYASDDPKRLGDRIALQAEVIIGRSVQEMDLKTALRSAAQLAEGAGDALARQLEIAALGLEILGVSVLAVRATPDMGRALEAEAREANLKAADDAIYLRRMAAVENERAIRQNELDTEVAVEEKQRQIQDARMDAKASVMRRENELRTEQMDADVSLEEKRRRLVEEQAVNTRTLAEAEAHRVDAVMRALQSADPRVVQSLAAVGMDPAQLIAQAFTGIADKAEKIGQLTVSPELLTALTAVTGRKAKHG